MFQLLFSSKGSNIPCTFEGKIASTGNKCLQWFCTTYVEWREEGNCSLKTPIGNICNFNMNVRHTKCLLLFGLSTYIDYIILKFTSYVLYYSVMLPKFTKDCTGDLTWQSNEWLNVVYEIENLSIISISFIHVAIKFTFIKSTEDEKYTDICKWTRINHTYKIINDEWTDSVYNLSP